MADREDGINRRHALECMIWAGTGVLWTVAGGVPKSMGLLGDAQAAETSASALTFLQISDSHVGFEKPANPNALGTLQEAIDKVGALPSRPSFMACSPQIFSTKATSAPSTRSSPGCCSASRAWAS